MLQGETDSGQMEIQGLTRQKGSDKCFKYADDVTRCKNNDLVLKASKTEGLTIVR